MDEHSPRDHAVQRPARKVEPPSRHIRWLDLAQYREHGRGIGLQLARRGHAGGIARLQGLGLRTSRFLVGASGLLRGARGLLARPGRRLLSVNRQVGHDERDRTERGHHAHDEPPAQAPRALGESHDGREITLFALAEPDARARPLLGTTVLVPSLGVLGRAIAPEQALGPTARLPLLGRGAQSGQELRVLLALVEPLPELRPPVDQGLVDQLHGRALALPAGLDEQEPCAGQVLDHLRDRVASVPLAVLRERAELIHAHHRARALGRDQAQQHRAGQPLLARRQRREHRVRVDGQGTGDAAELLIAVPRQEPALPIPRFPQLRGRELQERQGAPRALERVEHVLDHLRGLEPMTGRLDRPRQSLAQAVAPDGRQEREPTGHVGHERAVISHAIEKVRADGEHDAQG